MPKKIIKYQCSGCGIEYTSEKEAIACEKSHDHAVRICEEYYGMFPDIPEWLDVLMSDGSKVRYKFKERCINE